uniref:Uncharacterized protein n=1 Tax=Oryza nivara TaxID=4536 RepID=A0A0E0G1R1_ORYNI
MSGSVMMMQRLARQAAHAVTQRARNQTAATARGYHHAGVGAAGGKNVTPAAAAARRHPDVVVTIEEAAGAGPRPSSTSQEDAARRLRWLLYEASFWRGCSVYFAGVAAARVMAR